MSYPVLIVDDERLAREEIKRHLLLYPDFTIAGEAANADEAEELIRTIRPVLIFLDVQMPERSGFDLLESLEEIPEVIFTTAFDKYAVQAFDTNAIDYLVKPIREERFARAIERAQAALQPGNQPLSTLFIRDGERFHFIRVEEIFLIESTGNYARIYYGDKKTYLKRSLNQLEKTLDVAVFFRASRTSVINTRFIQSVKSLSDGRLEILLHNGLPVIVSNRQSAVFRSKHKQ
ncbi:LytR/AlgR family response regulator transcription factor [Paraflavitalea pollutisoli]|uniref:LytR/AlgR family response regulator transcription factor n=1 Tax=Paraflavitalea pollutisoli TaxID=3034143 RepID=UPI0023EAC393|nr:LytTR family DNA-binding domain-containing protein [Paraflavitalea sp. H1-2-19X]